MSFWLNLRFCVSFLSVLSLCKYFKKNTSQSNYGHIIVFTLFNFQGPYRFSDFFVFRLFSVGDFLILPLSSSFVKSFFRFFQNLFWSFRKHSSPLLHFSLFVCLSRADLFILPHPLTFVNTFLKKILFFVEKVLKLA